MDYILLSILILKVEIDQDFVFCYFFHTVYDERTICFGADCSTGSLKSPEYPNRYPSPFNGFYVIWVPEAQYINITFPAPFEIEDSRDFLYIGPGFGYPLGLNDGPVSSDPGQVYKLDGYRSPGPIFIEGDAVWMYFQTDNVFSVSGWHAEWAAGKSSTLTYLGITRDWGEDAKTYRNKSYKFLHSEMEKNYKHARCQGSKRKYILNLLSNNCYLLFSAVIMH